MVLITLSLIIAGLLIVAVVAASAISSRISRLEESEQPHDRIS